MTNFSVQQLTKIIPPILKKHDVNRASLFGSVVRGTMTKKSDVDLLIEFRGKKSLLDLIGLQQALEARLKRSVDVLTYRSIHPLLRDQILKEQKVIFERSV